jgi:tRNA threonylcarbamoyladenosine biosynthesis protein TsaE
MPSSDLLARLFSPEGIVCAQAEDTRNLGAALAEHLATGMVLSLEGPLGAGKTQLTCGLVQGLGCDTEATSPTFALLHEYTGGRLPVFHFDFYRMDSEAELLTAGFDDCLAAGVTVAEWGDKFSEALPRGAWRLQFLLCAEGGRQIVGIR